MVWGCGRARREIRLAGPVRPRGWSRAVRLGRVILVSAAHAGRRCVTGAATVLSSIRLLNLLDSV